MGRGSELSIREMDSGLILAGEIDVFTAPELGERLTKRVNQIRAVCVDMRDVSFVDSSGLHALLDAAARCRALGGDLEILAPSPRVRRLIELTGTGALFTFVGAV